MERTYGIMLIGCGHIGLEHLADIYHRPGISIKAVIDTDEQRAKQAAARCVGAVAATDYRTFLKQKEIDIVIVATYADSHCSIVKDCLRHHKHVLCEKPIATSLQEGKSFVNAVRAAKEKVLISHILRHNQSYQKIKELIDSDAIGQLRLMRMTQNHHAIDWARYCRLMKDCSPTVDCGVHYYDLAQWISGSPITTVTGFGTKTQPDAPRDNYTFVTFTMANGCTGFYEAGWGQALRSSNVKEFIGTKGRITLQMRANRIQDREEGDLITVYRSDMGTYKTINVSCEYKAMFAQLQVLIDMIEQDIPGTPTIEEAYSAFLVSFAADEAITRHTTVAVDSTVGSLIRQFHSGVPPVKTLQSVLGDTVSNGYTPIQR